MGVGGGGGGGGCEGAISFDHILHVILEDVEVTGLECATVSLLGRTLLTHVDCSFRSYLVRTITISLSLSLSLLVFLSHPFPLSFPPSFRPSVSSCEHRPTKHSIITVETSSLLCSLLWPQFDNHIIQPQLISEW